MVTALLTATLMIVTGALAAAALIAARRPEAKQALDKLVPYQGVLGIVSALWGAYNTVVTLINVKLVTVIPVTWVLLLATSLVMLSLGFVLGFALISKYALAGSPDAVTKGETIRARLVTFQTPLGLASVALGVWVLVRTFI